MAEQPALLADPELRLVGELARLADVVNERRRHQQVGVEPGMELAQLADQRPHGDRVLDEPTQVGVVAAPGARRAAKIRCQRLGEDKPLDDPAQAGIVDLAGQVLEEALELLDRAIGGGQELGRVERPGFQPAHVIELRGQLSLVALELAANEDRVAPFEAQTDPVGLAEDAGRQGCRCGHAARAPGRRLRCEPSAGPCARTRSDPRTAGRNAAPRSRPQPRSPVEIATAASTPRS